MQRSVLSIAVVTCLVLGLALGLATAQEEQMCVPMGDITLEALSSDAQRESVSFPHAVHFTYKCQACHHGQEIDSPIVGCTTSGCHDLAQAPRGEDGRLVKDEDATMRYYKNAYHGLCIGCHKEIKQKNKSQEASKLALGEKSLPTGPTGCNECHPKE
jgi:hypothetical protein